MSTSNNNDSASKSNNDGVCEINDILQNIKTDNISNACANCDKGEDSSISLKACTACEKVMYCNAACKKKHRYKHKQACREHLSTHTKLIKMSSTAIAILPAHAYGGARGIAKLLIADRPLGREFLSLHQNTSIGTKSFHHLDDWSQYHEEESTHIFWSARLCFCLLEQKEDNITTLQDALADICCTYKLLNFQTFEAETAFDIAECIISLLYTFQGEGSRDAALQSDEFGSLPPLIQQLFKIFWFGNKHKLVPTEHFALPIVDSSERIAGTVKMSSKVSSFVDFNGNLRLMNSSMKLKEATTMFELAMWKSKLDQARTDGVNRGVHRINIPGPVKYTILQYLNYRV